MTEKVFNHEVTAGLLRGWCAKDARDKDGLWYWDLSGAQSKPIFERGRNARFAGVDFLYVGNNKGRPLSVAVEDGLGTHENLLARFVQRLWKRSLANDREGHALARGALAGILGFSNRGAWSITGLSELFDLSDEQRLEFLEDQFSAVMNSFSHWDFVFFQEAPASLLICDAPLFDLRLVADRAHYLKTDTVLMPLGPSAAMIGIKSDRKGAPRQSKHSHWTKPIDCEGLDIQISISKVPLSNQMTELFNQFTLHRARRWVVAKTENELLAQTAFLQQDNLLKRIETDSVVITNGGQFFERRNLKPPLSND